MVAHTEAACRQLTDELAARALDWAALLGTDLESLLRERAHQAAPRLIAELEAGSLADETALDILALLWPHTDPDLDWWRTPLGLLIAPSWAARTGDTGWTRAQAAQVLGVSPGTVAQLGARGSLGVLVEGGAGQFSRVAVLARLVRLARQEA